MLKLATLCYVRRPGQTLMLHRVKKQNDMHAGKWNGLGGKFEPGESPEECAVREVREESGLLAHRPELRGFLTFPGFRPDEDWYAFVFVIHHYTGELIDSAEGNLAWIDDDKLLALPLWEGDRIFLPWLDRDTFFSGKFVYEQGALVSHAVTFYSSGRVIADLSSNPASVSVATSAAGASFQPIYTTKDDTYCWVCGGTVLKRNCKIVCRACGFTRDCSDP